MFLLLNIKKQNKKKQNTNNIKTKKKKKKQNPVIVHERFCMLNSFALMLYLGRLS